MFLLLVVPASPHVVSIDAGFLSHLRINKQGVLCCLSESVRPLCGALDSVGV